MIIAGVSARISSSTSNYWHCDEVYIGFGDGQKGGFDALAEEGIKQWAVSALTKKVGDKIDKLVKYFRRQVLPVLLSNIQDLLELAGVNI